MNHKKENIILISPIPSSFVKSDISLLSEKYRVQVNIDNWRNKYRAPLNIVRQKIFLLRHIRTAKAIVVEFGGYGSFLPALFGRIFGKPVFIVLHGTDCVSFPQLSYGNLRKPLLRFFCRMSYRMASCLLPVSESLIYTENGYYSDTMVKQGYKFFFPEINTPAKVIFNAVDNDFWKPDPSCIREENTFITVLSPGQFVLKGLDLILKAAPAFPECKFYVAGISKPDDIAGLPNVHFSGKVSSEELRGFFNRSRFYFQLSVSEGFGLALCESMLCGCIPIGSQVNFIPEIIGETGFILPKRDVEMLGRLIQTALSSENKDELSSAARERIREKFPPGLRKKSLTDCIESRVKC